MSQPSSSNAGDISEDNDDEEIVALLPAAESNGKDETDVGSLRRTPGPHTMRKNVSFTTLFL